MDVAQWFYSWQQLDDAIKEMAGNGTLPDRCDDCFFSATWDFYGLPPHVDPATRKRYNIYEHFSVAHEDETYILAMFYLIERNVAPEE